jgi:hypothetical protein
VLYDGFYEKLIIYTMNLTFAYRFHTLCGRDGILNFVRLGVDAGGFD